MITRHPYTPHRIRFNMCGICGKEPRRHKHDSRQAELSAWRAAWVEATKTVSLAEEHIRTLHSLLGLRCEWPNGRCDVCMTVVEPK